MPERRRYFRIDDQIILRHRVIAEDDASQAIARFKLGQYRMVDVHHALTTLERQADAVIGKVKESLPEMGDALALLNNKINLLAKLVTAQGHNTLDEGTRAVNLSACGVAFANDRAIDTGAALEMEMVLFPSYIFVPAYGTVTHCDPSDDAQFPFTVRVEFTAIREEDREMLIQHILNKQSGDLRRRREAMDEDDSAILNLGE